MSDPSLEFHEGTTLHDIKLVSRRFSLPRLDQPVSNTDHYRFKVTIGIIIHKPDNEVIKEIHVKIVSQENEKETFAEYQVLFYFHINQLEKFLSDKDQSGLQSDFDGWLSNVVLATTRGIMYTDLRGTFLDRALLPLISPDMLKGN